MADYRPNQLTAYLFELANRYSTFFEQCPVLRAESAELRQSRLLLVRPHRPNDPEGAGVAGDQTWWRRCRDVRITGSRRCFRRGRNPMPIARSMQPDSTMSEQPHISRRSGLKCLGRDWTAAMFDGHAADAAVTASEPPRQSTEVRTQIFAKVWRTPLIDTHEHLCDEQECTSVGGFAAGVDDWSVVLSGYLGSDSANCGNAGGCPATLRFERPVAAGKVEVAGTLLARREECRLRTGCEDLLARSVRRR